MKNKLISWMIDLLYPRRCALCDRIADTKRGICKACMPKIKYVSDPVCMKCGKKMKKDDHEYCRDCQNRMHYFTQGKILYEYEEIADSIFRFKYAGRQEYAKFYGRELFEAYGDFLKLIGANAIIPVPVHPIRKRKRGYNQAELIGKELSEQTGIPLKEKLVIRQKNTIPQKGLTPLERQNNLKKAFKLRQNDVKLDTIVIIDDIYTTGSTIDALGLLFLNAGVKKVYFLALASGSGN